MKEEGEKQNQNARDLKEEDNCERRRVEDEFTADVVKVLERGQIVAHGIVSRSDFDDRKALEVGSTGNQEFSVTHVKEEHTDPENNDFVSGSENNQVTLGILNSPGNQEFVKKEFIKDKEENGEINVPVSVSDGIFRREVEGQENQKSLGATNLVEEEKESLLSSKGNTAGIKRKRGRPKKKEAAKMKGVAEGKEEHVRSDVFKETSGEAGYADGGKQHLLEGNINLGGKAGTSEGRENVIHMRPVGDGKLGGVEGESGEVRVENLTEFGEGSGAFTAAEEKGGGGQLSPKEGERLLRRRKSVQKSLEDKHKMFMLQKELDEWSEEERGWKKKKRRCLKGKKKADEGEKSGGGSAAAERGSGSGKKRGRRKKSIGGDGENGENVGEALMEKDEGAPENRKKRDRAQSETVEFREGETEVGEKINKSETMKPEKEAVLKSTQKKKYDENGNLIESVMCHQCQRNDKGKVVRCSKCTTKRYCVPCMTRWYPGRPEEAFVEACPVCCQNCNCKACLRLDMQANVKVKSGLEFKDEEKMEYSKYVIQLLFPFLKQINAEQMTEKQMEAHIKALSTSEVKVKKAKCGRKERIYCNNCTTSIFDYHRSCPNCSYDLCLTCCREIRNGCLQGVEEGPTLEFNDPGIHYLHGLNDPSDGLDKQKSLQRTRKLKMSAVDRTCNIPVEDNSVFSGESCNLEIVTDDRTCNAAVEDNFSISGKLACNLETSTDDDRIGNTAVVDDSSNFQKSEWFWKSNPDGSIPCPPHDMGGCGQGCLELRSILGDNTVSVLFLNTEEIVQKYNLGDIPEVSGGCFCRRSAAQTNIDPENLRKAASRGDSQDNYLYSPKAVDIKPGDLEHFQRHWIEGEPVIVRDVLETTRGLSWEPMVMWRAFRQIKNLKHNTLLDVVSMNCLDWCEVSCV